jgi:hypothetical protein
MSWRNLLLPFALKVEGICTSETLVNTCHIAWDINQEDQYLSFLEV